MPPIATKGSLLVTALSFTLLTGCSDPSLLSNVLANGGGLSGSTSQEAMGGVTVNIRGLSGLRKVQATVADIDHITVTVQDGLKAQVKTLAKDALSQGEASAGFVGLMPGQASVSAEVFDALGAPIGSGSVTVTIESRKNTTATIPIQLIPTIVDGGNLNTDIIITDGEVKVINQRPPLHFINGDYSANTPPTTSANVDASPRIAGLTLSSSPVLTALDGSFSFQDSPSGVKDLLIQIQGTPGHFIFPVPQAAFDTHSLDLSFVTLPETFTHGEHLMSFALRDNAGNVSPYLTGKVTVGEAQAVEVSQLGPLKIIGAIPSQSTDYYKQTNGIDPEYDMTRVAEVDFAVNRGNASHLYLAGDAEGTRPTGWDNALVVEYRASKDGPLLKRWVYGALDANTQVADLVQGEAPTVSGHIVGVPSADPFGWQPAAIDLMSQIPDAPQTFHLRFVFFDFGSVGSTTDAWMIPRSTPWGQ